MMKHRLLHLLITGCLLLAASCARPSAPGRAWAYADLRLLDPLDDEVAPSTDLLAVYTRFSGSDLEIRLDLLDLAITPDYGLQFLFDTGPGGDPWDMTFRIPAAGASMVTPADIKVIPRIVRDPWLDTFIVRFNRRFFPETFSLKILSFIAGSDIPADQTAVIRSDGQPPLSRAPVLLAFRDSFPVVTPAQALRRWDGAHTGPNGRRHGLKHVLSAASRYDIPVTLLDLKTPTSLAAVNVMGVTGLLRDLSDRGLLLLPDVAYSEPGDISLNFSRRAAAGFGLPASQFVYAISSEIQSGYLARFESLSDPSHLASAGRTRLIPLPAEAAMEATGDGLALDVRRALLNTALSTDPADLVVLGGSLPHSTWGDADMALPSIKWIAAHPWIQPLTGEDLMTFPVGKAGQLSLPPESENTYPVYTNTGQLASLDSAALKEAIQDELTHAPQNAATTSAWQMYLALSAPTADARLEALRYQYLDKVLLLLQASQWAEDPYQEASVFMLPSGEVHILASESVFAVISPAGARLLFLFHRDASGVHQVVAPSSQFTVGLSDPSEWHPERGEAADPSAIPGAFTDRNAPWMDYQAQPGDRQITLTASDGSGSKTYRLTDNGIEVTYQVQGPVATRIPLVLDPQAFYFGPSQYQGILSSRSWIWGLDGGLVENLSNSLSVEVRTDAMLSAQGFTASTPFLPLPENPDQDYPAGHFFPFPLSVVEIQGEDHFQVELIIHE